MTDHDEHLRNLTVAVSVVTAWRDRELLGERVVPDLVGDALREAGPAQLVYAMADLISGTLTGLDRTVADLLANGPVLVNAARRVAAGDPVTATDVGLDTSTVLARIGLWASSVQT